MSEWNDIETAPKNGTRVAVASWSKISNRWRIFDAYYNTGMRKPLWIFDGWSSINQPTHWMPLPEPPLASSKPE